MTDRRVLGRFRFKSPYEVLGFGDSPEFVLFSSSLERFIRDFHAIPIVRSLKGEKLHDFAGYRFSVLHGTERHSNILPHLKAMPHIRQAVQPVALYALLCFSWAQEKICSLALCQTWQAPAWIPVIAPCAVHRIIILSR
jgi:hypothetical protein